MGDTRTRTRCARARLAQPDGRATVALRAPDLRTLSGNAQATHDDTSRLAAGYVALSVKVL